MVNAGKGSMAAVIGFDRNQLDLLAQKIDDIVIAKIIALPKLYYQDLLKH